MPANAEHSLVQMLTLSAVFMGLTFVVFLFYGRFAALARAYVLESKKLMAWIRGVTALAFGAMSVRLAMSRI